MTRPLVGARVDTTHKYGRGLIGAWLCNAGAGSTLLDSTHQAAHGTFLNVADGWAGSDAGWALELDGVDDYVSIGSHEHLQPKLGITVALSVFATADQSNMGMVSDWGTNAIWVFRTVPTTFEPQFLIRVGAANKDAASANALPLNVWTHLVGTWGVPVAENRVRLIVNGDEVVAGDSTAGPIDDLGSNVDVGRWQSSPARGFGGKIRDILFWDRGMTVAEAKGLYTLRLDELFV